MNKRFKKIKDKITVNKNIDCLTDDEILYLVKYLNAHKDDANLFDFKLFLINNCLTIQLLHIANSIEDDNKKYNDAIIFYRNFYNSYHKNWNDYYKKIDDDNNKNHNSKHMNILIKISIDDFNKYYRDVKDINLINDFNLDDIMSNKINLIDLYYFKISFNDYYLNKHIFYNNLCLFKQYNNDDNYYYFACDFEQLQHIERNLNFKFKSINDYCNRSKNTYYVKKTYYHKGKKFTFLNENKNNYSQKTNNKIVNISDSFNTFLFKIINIDVNNILDKMFDDVSYSDSIKEKNNIINNTYHYIIDSIKLSHLRFNDDVILCDYFNMLFEQYFIDDDSYYKYDNNTKLKGKSYHTNNTDINNYVYDNNNLRIIK